MRVEKFSLQFISLAVAATLATGNFAAAAEETDDVAELKKQIEALQKRVEELEADKRDSSGSPAGRYRRGFGLGWDPFEEISRMREEMDRLFQDPFGGPGGQQGTTFGSSMSFDTDLDLKETDDGYEITLDMTGLDKEKVDIQINEHSITVKGEHSRQDTEEGPNRYFSSQSYGSFMKTIPLPTDADTARAETEKEGDRLVIRLPKKNI